MSARSDSSSSSLYEGDYRRGKQYDAYLRTLESNVSSLGPHDHNIYESPEFHFKEDRYRRHMDQAHELRQPVTNLKKLKNMAAPLNDRRTIRHNSQEEIDPDEMFDKFDTLFKISYAKDELREMNSRLDNLPRVLSDLFMDQLPPRPRSRNARDSLTFYDPGAKQVNNRYYPQTNNITYQPVYNLKVDGPYYDMTFNIENKHEDSYEPRRSEKLPIINNRRNSLANINPLDTLTLKTDTDYLQDNFNHFNRTRLMLERKRQLRNSVQGVEGKLPLHPNAPSFLHRRSTKPLQDISNMYGTRGEDARRSFDTYDSRQAQYQQYIDDSLDNKLTRKTLGQLDDLESTNYFNARKRARNDMIQKIYNENLKIRDTSKLQAYETSYELNPKTTKAAINYAKNTGKYINNIKENMNYPPKPRLDVDAYQTYARPDSRKGLNMRSTNLHNIGYKYSSVNAGPTRSTSVPKR